MTKEQALDFYIQWQSESLSFQYEDFYKFMNSKGFTKQEATRVLDLVLLS